MRETGAVRVEVGKLGRDQTTRNACIGGLHGEERERVGRNCPPNEEKRNKMSSWSMRNRRYHLVKGETY